MPNNTQQDIAFQPKTQGYSYSNSPKGKEKKSNIFFVLALEIFGLLFLFFVFLAVLNYFNILSLSTIYPNQLGFLPHITTNNPQKIATPTPTSNDIQAKNLEKYLNYAKSHHPNEAYFNSGINAWVAEGIFAGYSGNNIQIATSKGILNLLVDKDTSLSELKATNTKSNSLGGTLGISQNYTLTSFVKNVNYGSFLQTFYVTNSNSLSTAKKIYYIPN